MGLWSLAIATAEDTGVGHDQMDSPPGLQTTIPVVSPIPTTSGGTVCFAEPPPVPSTPEQASTSNSPMIPSPPHVQEMILLHFIDCWEDICSSRNSTDPEKAFGNFKHDNEPIYPSQHV